MARKIIGILLASLSLLGLLIGTACESTTPKQATGGPVERLTLGTSAVDLSALIWIAKAKGFFTEQRLDMDYKLYESGHLALKDLLAGKLDLATATEFAAVRLGLDRPDFRIISILDQARDQQLVARRDRGISTPADLKNKRVGVARNTSSEYYLQLLVVLEKMQSEDVHTVDLLPSGQVTAIAQGDTDAAMVWEPFVTMMKGELGKNAVSWSGQSGQDEYWLLLGTIGTIEKQPHAIRRFLSALASAEEFVKNHESGAMEIMAKHLGDRHLGSLWKNHRFRLGLHRPFVLKMEAELKWIKSRGGTRQSEIPDLSGFIYFDALNAVDPKKNKMLR